MLRLRGEIDGRERVIPLTGDEVRLGRGSDSDLVLPDFSVSRRHAALRRSGAAWFVHDLQSTNGVQVNGATVTKSPLKAGDRLKIGIFHFVVDEDDPRSAHQEGDVASPVSTTAPLPAPPPPAEGESSISSATIIRRIADFSADYGLEEGAATGTERVSPLAEDRAKPDAVPAVKDFGATIFSVLTRLGRVLIRASSVDDALDKVLSIGFETLKVDRGFILLKDEASGELVCELSRVGERVEFRPESAVPVSHTMLQAVMRERVALLTYDAQADQRLATGESIRIHQIRAAMCAPLWAGDDIVGVMQVDSPFHVGSFDQGDLDLFTALANYAAVAVQRIRSEQRVEYEKQVRSRLERYHSPAVIEAVLTQDDAADPEGGVRRLKPARVTVLFADVVGFTTMAENLPPEDVAEVLGGYFTHSVEAIFAHGGTLDKFIGDCVMAFFGAPMPQQDHAQRAVRAAVEIQRAIDRWNRERSERGAPPVLARIAINSGPVVVGDIGSQRRVDYTVLGNTVNVASRLEGAAAGPGEIVVGGSTFDELEGQFETEPLGELRLKGLQQRVPVYRVRWQEGAPAPGSPAEREVAGGA